MIFWEIDGGASTPPTGGATQSSSGSGSTQVAQDSSQTIVTGSESVLNGYTVAATGEQTFASRSFQASAGNATETNENSQQRTESSTESARGEGDNWAWSVRGAGQTSSTSSFKEINETHLALGTDGAGSATVQWARTFALGVTVTSSVGSTSSWTYGSPTSSSSSSTSYSTSATTTLTSTASGSSTSSSAAIGSMQSQTSTTATTLHHGTTTATATATSTAWTTNASSEAVTTATTITRTVTASSDFTFTATVTTTMVGTIAAGHQRHTIVLADCGSQLLVAAARAGEEHAAARDWFVNEGTSVLLKPMLATSVTSGTTTQATTATGSSTTAFVSPATSTGGATFNRTSSTSSEGHGQTVNAAGVLVAAAGGIYPVAASVADYAFDFPTFGSSGPLTLRYTGPCALAITINPGYGQPASYSTLHASASQAVTMTFRPGVDVVVDACMAYAPAAGADAQFQPWYVIEKPCRLYPLT